MPGGWKWSRDRKRAYANDLSDPDHLVAVHQGLNRSKGSKGPDQWPGDAAPEAFPYCWYAETWIRIKDRWELELPPSEGPTPSQGACKLHGYPGHPESAEVRLYRPSDATPHPQIQCRPLARG